MTSKQINPKLKKGLIIATCVILAFCILATSTYFILLYMGKRGLLSSGGNLNIDDIDNAYYDENAIVYQGKVYHFNTNITATLFIGCDNKKAVSETNIVYGKNGQADTLMLLTCDTKTGKTVITAIPRDTMAEIDIYAKNGDFLTTQKEQICLSYAYGDGKHTSCEYTIKAVSKLLRGMPINSYLAIDKSAMAEIQNKLGSVTVTPNEDLTMNIGRGEKIYFTKGKTTTIQSQYVSRYLTLRSQNPDSSYLRMERQLDYLKAVSKKVIEKTKQDITYPISLYTTFSKKATTNLTADKITFLTTAVFNNRNNIDLEFKQVIGTQILGEDGYAEFHADRDYLLELVLELFYVAEE